MWSATLSLPTLKATFKSSKKPSPVPLSSLFDDKDDADEELLSDTESVVHAIKTVTISHPKSVVDVAAKASPTKRFKEWNLPNFNLDKTRLVLSKRLSAKPRVAYQELIEPEVLVEVPSLTKTSTPVLKPALKPRTMLSGLFKSRNSKKHVRIVTPDDEMNLENTPIDPENSQASTAVDSLPEIDPVPFPPLVKISNVVGYAIPTIQYPINPLDKQAKIKCNVVCAIQYIQDNQPERAMDLLLELQNDYL
jgi:hypothetical protein